MIALRRFVPLSLLLVLGFASAASAATPEVPLPATPTQWVTDTAGFLSPATVSSLDDRLAAYEGTTGHQVLVYVAPTTGLAPTEDWTSRAFAKWKVGRKGIDDGLVLFVFSTDHKVRVEVGYGLEQTVPDAIASRIIRDTIVPKIRAGRQDDAIVGGVDALLATIGGEATAQQGSQAQPNAVPTPEDYTEDEGVSTAGVIIGIVLAIGIIVLIAFLISKLPKMKGTYVSGGNSGFGVMDALSIGGSLLGGLGGGGGGGFSGGGGMGGGGGATGSW